MKMKVLPIYCSLTASVQVPATHGLKITLFACLNISKIKQLSKVFIIGRFKKKYFH